MEYIRNRKHCPSSGHALSLPVAAVAASLAFAQPSAPRAAEAGVAEEGAQSRNSVTLDNIEVQGGGGYLVEQVSSPKFVRPVQDTPQTIQVIDSRLFNEQGATTLTEALRNSAGVGTFYAGENGSTATGDALFMRGFDTAGNLFVDGVRDVGSVSRDVFNVQQIEVVKGPAGTDIGRAAPTGAINLVTKEAGLQDGLAGTVSAGVDGQRRATADWNRQLGPGSGMRLNAMWQDSDVPGRDHVANRRWGIAPSFGFGLDGATRGFVNLLHVRQENVPDGFVPTIGLPGWEPQPGLEHLAGRPVAPSNFYGTRNDHDDVTAQMATFRLERDVGEAVTLSNVMRWGRTRQEYMLTSFMSSSESVGLPEDARPNDPSAYTLERGIPTFKDQTNRILTDQLNLRADFVTGGVLHNLSAGMELIREDQGAPNFSREGSLPAANLYAPDWNETGTLRGWRNGTGSNGRTDTAAAYLFDTLEFGERLLLTAGLRADRYRTRYRADNLCNTPGTSGGSGRGIVYCGELAPGSVVETSNLRASDTLLNWKLGAVFRAAHDLNLYANYALSQQPPGGANFQLSGSAGNANNPNLEPQVARTIELGAKWTLPGGRLAFNTALFRTVVSNEINTLVTDEAGNPTQTGRKQVRGVELSLVGEVTPNWWVSAGYSHLDTRVVEGMPVAVDGTPNLTYTPGNTFTAWSTWHTSHGIEVGGGVRHVGGMHRGASSAVGTPARTAGYTVVDAVLSWPVTDHVAVRLNGYNLGDRRYIAAINKSGYRYMPGTPRTFLFSVDYRF